MDVRVCVRAYDTHLNIMIDFYAQASNVAVNMDSFLIGWAHAAGSSLNNIQLLVL